MLQPVHLVDVACYKPDEECRVDHDKVLEVFAQKQSEEVTDFQRRILAKSGLAAVGTYLPKSINPCICGNVPKTGLDAAAEECKMTVTGAVRELLDKTGLDPSGIDIVITTCSIYCPTPSMASMLVNEFRMRPDVQSYHLGGMGCANGVVAISLVRDLLAAHPDSNLLFVTTEVVTPAFYPGRDRARMVTNLLFRMGAAASLFSNNSSWGQRVKYKLLFNERVHIGQNDSALKAIHYSPDDDGIPGIFLGKDVVTEASHALTRAIRAVGPKVLCITEQLRYAHDAAARAMGMRSKKEPAYVPTFSGSVQHLLIHAGGAKVLDGLGKALRLKDADVAPSRAVLHDYGNVSSSTTWYTLGFIETVRGVKRGDRLMQIGVGSGIKCGVNIWQATRDIDDVHAAWEHRLPASERQASARCTSGAGLMTPKPHFVDVAGQARTHLYGRALFVLLMAMLVGMLHFYMLLVHDGGLAGPAAAQVSNGSGAASGVQPVGLGDMLAELHKTMTQTMTFVRDTTAQASVQTDV